MIILNIKSQAVEYSEHSPLKTAACKLMLKYRKAVQAYMETDTSNTNT